MKNFFDIAMKFIEIENPDIYTTHREKLDSTVVYYLKGEFYEASLI